MLDYPFNKTFPITQSKAPLAELIAISSCSVTRYLGKGAIPYLTAAFSQAIVEGDEMLPEAPLLQAKHHRSFSARQLSRHSAHRTAWGCCDMKMGPGTWTY